MIVSETFRATSVIDCAAVENSIKEAIETILSPAFISRLSVVDNPYGNGGSSDTILNLLETASLNNVLKKSFFNISFD